MSDWIAHPWMDKARCAQIGGNDWFPEPGGRDTKAQNVCTTCPVANQCLAYSIQHRIMYGTWGGVPENKRRRLIAQHNRTEAA